MKNLEHFPIYALIANYGIALTAIYFLYSIATEFQYFATIIYLVLVVILYFCIPVSYIKNDEFVSTPFYLFKQIRKRKYQIEFRNDIKRGKDFWMETHFAFINFLILDSIRYDSKRLEKRQFQRIIERLEPNEEAKFSSDNVQIESIVIQFIGVHPNNMNLFRFNPILWPVRVKKSLIPVRHYRISFNLKHN